MKNNKKIGIIGYGYVGKAFYEFFRSHFSVSIYDNGKRIQDEYDYVEKNTEFLNSMDLVVICVPTNALESGCVDLSAVEDSLKLLKNDQLVLIKSTIPPLTTGKFADKYPHLRIVFSPEYIGESKYHLPPPYNFDKKVIETPYFIFGGKKEDTEEVIAFFKIIAGPVKEYIQTESLEAEICKYMENTFFATKIVFCNEFAQICRKIGASYSKVRELWLKDPRITKTHTDIHNEESNQCFGGKCLPKDLSGIVTHTFENGYRARFLESVSFANNTLRQEAQKPNILAFHRILLDDAQMTSLYLDRKMAVGYYTLEAEIQSYLNRGFCFGSIEQCLKEPKRYFACSFDDGFKEHLEVIKRLSTQFGAPKESLICAINVNHSLRQIYSGMDLIYHLVSQGRKHELIAYFTSRIENFNAVLMDDTLSLIKALKPYFIALDSKALWDFHSTFQCDLTHIYLGSEQIQALSKYALIASHGIYHRDLSKHVDQSNQEILESKRELEQLINKEVDIFCYPEGKNNQEVQDMCKRHGFDFALSTNHKKNNPYCIGRKFVTL
ncbi:MAG: polysaccharide deacetylase family protein [Helicobacter trogontum]|uniref:polysaccharide deacetylase family protein n=1 Tax=Helicobacter trogontum TaxID=50960 RepID=UPI002430E3B9|nr:polysaccharide deacetylase family protein [Helicobacter trogontum]MCI5787345.1 polysaccharide deacetylase family protein [Helicobacter trogontum]